MKRREEKWDSEPLGERKFKSGKLKPKEKSLSLPKERIEGGEMLIMNKTSSSNNHDDLLMNIERFLNFKAFVKTCIKLFK